MPNGAIYLTTVGYGTGALLGRGVENVEAVHWADELGMGAGHVGPEMPATWGRSSSPRISHGTCLFERENAKIAPGLAAAYEGTRPPTMKRYGETDDRTDEVIS